MMIFILMFVGESCVRFVRVISMSVGGEHPIAVLMLQTLKSNKLKRTKRFGPLLITNVAHIRELVLWHGVNRVSGCIRVIRIGSQFNDFYSPQNKLGDFENSIHV